MIFYDFENASTAESSHWLGVGMLVAHLGPHESSAHIVFNVFGETAKSVETISQPRNWLRRVGGRHFIDTSALAIEQTLGQIWQVCNQPGSFEDFGKAGFM